MISNGAAVRILQGVNEGKIGIVVGRDPDNEHYYHLNIGDKMGLYYNDEEIEIMEGQISKYNKSELLAAIEGMKSVCAEGRKEVQNLIEKLIGEKLAPEINKEEIKKVLQEGNVLIKSKHLCDIYLFRGWFADGEGRKFHYGGCGGKAFTEYSNGAQSLDQIIDYLLNNKPFEIYSIKKVEIGELLLKG